MSDEGYIELSEGFRPEHGWSLGGGLEVLVDTSAYAGPDREQPEWCKFTRVAPGTAAVYPVKAEVPELGEGQWRWDEVQGWRAATYWIDACEDVERAHPGHHPPWLKRELDIIFSTRNCRNCGHLQGSHKDVTGCVVAYGYSPPDRCGCTDFRPVLELDRKDT